MVECAEWWEIEAREALVAEVFEIDGRRVLGENIPAMVCALCGEPVFSRETTEKVRRMVRGEAEPVGTLQLDVLDYA